MRSALSDETLADEDAADAVARGMNENASISAEASPPNRPTR
jgi:hypothetical protein